ncbi:MAG TPA: hypothetical protein VFX28_10710 [Methylomirabilota bacterium]|nr:hypothetical protein [Methylomirabilota bacterium]
MSMPILTLALLVMPAPGPALAVPAGAVVEQAAEAIALKYALSMALPGGVAEPPRVPGEAHDETAARLGETVLLGSALLAEPAAARIVLVPETRTLVVLGLGLIGLGTAVRWHRRRREPPRQA